MLLPTSYEVVSVAKKEKKCHIWVVCQFYIYDRNVDGGKVACVYYWNTEM